MSVKKQDNRLKKIYFWGFVVYLAAVLYITVFSREPGERRFDMEPFRSYILLIRDRNYFYAGQIFLNILMTVPYGFLLPGLNVKYRSLRKVIFMGLGFSTAIETIQYITCRGLFEFDDLFNNTLGASVGYIIFVVLHRKIIKLIDMGK